MKHDTALNVLMIERGSGDHTSFAEKLNHKNYQVTSAPSGKAGLAIFDTVDPKVVVVDVVSLNTKNGVRICQSFRKKDNDLPIILIVSEETELPEDVDANLVLRLPFTAQKLINRLKVYFPTNKKFILKAGPITLNTQTQLVSCYDKQTKLTPRLVSILTMLMKHRGKVIKRNVLFTKVWETNYTVDTRTLDVHISWLRHAIEEDPQSPRLIRTQRGVGYKLDL
ncbi:MAG: response regulator transcription factor [Chloroflexota bacterium]|nr:response regulator transcription factor [Chloroflexota bacterium]